MTAPTSAPTTSIGYATDAGAVSWWRQTMREPTPELRWPRSVQVYESMRRQDAQVQSVIRAVTLPVRRTPWRIDPAGARPEVVALVAEDLGLPITGADEADAPQPRTRGRFSWSEHLSNALLSLTFGHAFFEQEATIDAAGLARLRKLSLRPSHTLSAINVARDGGLESIEQRGTDRPIPVARLVAYVNEREAANWVGTSLLRPAYKHWAIKDRLLRVQAQTIERNGMGVPVFTDGPKNTFLAEGLKIAQDYRSGENSGASIPNQSDLRLRGVEGSVPDADPAIRYHDEQIARSALLHFLNLGTQTGSWALGTTFAEFFTFSLQSVAEVHRDVAQQHVVEDLVDWNWGPDEPAPRIVFDEIGSRHASTAQAIKLLIDAGALSSDPALERHLRQAYGLPSPDPDAPPRNPVEDM